MTGMTSEVTVNFSKFDLSDGNKDVHSSYNSLAPAPVLHEILFPYFLLQYKKRKKGNVTYLDQLQFILKDKISG